MIYERKPEIDKFINEEIQKESNKLGVTKLAEEIRQTKEKSYLSSITKSINKAANLMGIPTSVKTNKDPAVDFKSISEQIAKSTGDYTNIPHTNENFIMYTEFEIISQIKLDFFDLDGKSVTNTDYEKQSRHYIRLEKPIFK